MSSKGSAHDGLKFVTRVRALLRVAARPMISDAAAGISSFCAAVAAECVPVGELAGRSLNRSKREDVGRDGGGDVFKMSANGRDGGAGGSMERPVIGVLNLTARARLKAVEPPRALVEDDRGRVEGEGGFGALVPPCDILRKLGCKKIMLEIGGDLYRPSK
jgi:hypothetical protein